MSNRPPKALRSLLVLKSIWHWDLWVAVVVGIGVGIVYVQYTPRPKWEWIIPVVTVSVAILGLIWHQWTNLRSRLQGSNYGELIRMADELETEVRLPYTVARWIASVSILCSTVTAIVIEDIDNTWGEATMLAITGFFAMWLLFSVISLMFLSTEHDRNAAKMESWREQIAAEQRRYRSDILQPDTMRGEELEG